MADKITLESLKAIIPSKTDFGSTVYFMTEQQFNYCLWHVGNSMVKPRYGRNDANQSEILRALSKIPGVSARDLSNVGQGMTDILVGYKHVNYLIEIKDGNKARSAQRLTPDQVEFHSEHGWKGQRAVCNCLQDVLRIIGII